MRWVMAMLASFACAASALAGPPVVVDAVPNNGDVGVDPGLTEIRITFDRAMSRSGMSVVGGGENFPEITGGARWISTRTISIPVRLKPNHEYWLSINNERFNNFRSARNEPVVPYPIRFTTGPEVAPDPAEAGDGFGVCVDRAIARLADSYSHRDRLGLDWSSILEEQRAGLEASPSAGAFAKALGVVLARAEDKHIWVDADGERFASFVRPMVPNVDREALPDLIDAYLRVSPVVATGRLPGGIGYIAIDSWDRRQAEWIGSAFDGIWKMHDLEALVIDVRLNGGGDELLAREVAGCFVEDPVPYAMHVSVDPSRPGEFTEPSVRVLEPSTRRPRFRGRVAVLTGPVCMSSNEAFVLMMRQAGATVVGATTQGSSGNPKPHDLGRGVTLFLPSWRAMTMDGRPFEGVGIQPDERVEAGAGAFSVRDPVLDRAVELLADSE